MGATDHSWSCDTQTPVPAMGREQQPQGWESSRGATETALADEPVTPHWGRQTGHSGEPAPANAGVQFPPSLGQQSCQIPLPSGPNLSHYPHAKGMSNAMKYGTCQPFSSNLNMPALITQLPTECGTAAARLAAAWLPWSLLLAQLACWWTDAAGCDTCLKTKSLGGSTFTDLPLSFSNT